MTDILEVDIRTQAIDGPIKIRAAPSHQLRQSRAIVRPLDGVDFRRNGCLAKSLQTVLVHEGLVEGAHLALESRG
jgi:hypothetical protein